MGVRVRYPPSPTGFQHIGSVRTALYNYLFPAAQGGTFVLRIEDTDRKRFVPEALQDIYDTFAWLGFRWDEGPDSGRPFGPVLPVGAAGNLHRRTRRSCWRRARPTAATARRSGWRASARSRKRGVRGPLRRRATTGTAATFRRRSAAPCEAAGAPSVIRLAIPLEGVDELQRHAPRRHHRGEPRDQPGSRCSSRVTGFPPTTWRTWWTIISWRSPTSCAGRNGCPRRRCT